MTLHPWSHWFWITSLVSALILNVIADKTPNSSQGEVRHSVVPFSSFGSELSSKELEAPWHPTLTSSVEGTASQNKSNTREPKSISNLNVQSSLADSSEFQAHSRPEFLPTPFKAWSEASSTEVIATDSHNSYLIAETSNTSASSHLVPDRNTVAYSVDLSNSTEKSYNSNSTSTEPASSGAPFVAISKININKLYKNKLPDDKIIKKNSNISSNTINGITLKKILANNKTKQQTQLNSSVEAVTPVNISLSTSQFKDMDHTVFQNDSPAPENKIVLQNKTTEAAQTSSTAVHTSNIVPIASIKNETDEGTFFSSNETSTSLNLSSENASFSTLHEQIVSPDGTTLSTFNIIVIVVISATLVALTGLTGAVSFVMYRRYRWNKPQTLSDKCSNADSSGYIDDSTLRENSEEMYSLDNDSFLNSLEAMTIQNYWTDVKHTKL